MTKEEIFQEITGNPNIDDLSIGDRMMPEEIRRAMDMWAESEVKKLSLKPSVMRRLPTSEDVKRWHALLVGQGEEAMQKDIEATFA